MRSSQCIRLGALLLAAGMLTACGAESSQAAESSMVIPVVQTTTTSSSSSAAETTTTAAAETTTASVVTEITQADGTETTDLTAETTERIIVPTANGYTDDDLITLARRYYGSRSNWVPEFCYVVSIEGDTVTLHLYDLVDNHTASCSWYYIDRKTGKGWDLFDEPVDLSEPEAELYNPEVTQRESFPETACCGVQYIGTFPAGSGKANGYNAALIETLLMGGYGDEYPFIGRLMNDNTYAETQSAQELYLIIPRDPEARVIVTECDPVNESVFGPIYRSYNGCPFLLYCNHSEVASDVQIQITDNSGTHEAFSVYLSGMDGSPKTDNNSAVILNPILHTHYGE